MKGLGIVGFVAAVLTTLMAVYLQFIVVPAADAAEASMQSAFGSDIDFTSTAYRMSMQVSEFKITVAEYTMLGGILAFVLSIIPAIKKVKIAWAGVFLGLLCLLIGAAYGTHMFS